MDNDENLKVDNKILFKIVIGKRRLQGKVILKYRQ